MTKEDINNILDSRFKYFENGYSRGFFSENELNAVRLAFSKVKEDIAKSYGNIQS